MVQKAISTVRFRPGSSNNLFHVHQYINIACKYHHNHLHNHTFTLLLYKLDFQQWKSANEIKQMKKKKYINKNKTKQNKTKQNKTKQNKTKQQTSTPAWSTRTPVVPETRKITELTDHERVN